MAVTCMCRCVQSYIFVYKHVSVCVHVDHPCAMDTLSKWDYLCYSGAPAENTQENKGEEEEEGKNSVDTDVNPHTEHDGCEYEDILLYLEWAALDLFSIVNFLFNILGQEVKDDVMGGVHPDCLVYDS